MSLSDAEKSIRFIQRSKKWAEKEKDFLSAYTSGVNGGMKDFVKLILDTTEKKQILDIPNHKNRKRSILGITSKSVVVNRTGQTRKTIKDVQFSNPDSVGTIKGKDSGQEISILISKSGNGFIARLDLSGRLGTAQKVLINKYRIRIFTAAASKSKTIWKKMVAAGLQKQMAKAKGIFSR